MKDFRGLAVWHKSHRLTVEVYAATAFFPRNEIYGLVSQLRRGSSSIPANIAEGCGRGSNADFGRFLQNAMGSASELEYHLLLANELHMLSDEAHAELHLKTTEVKKMLAALLRRVRAEC